TTLPTTDSAVTVGGRGAFSDLQITVNQTRSLVNQAISVSWTGGQQTTSRTRFEANFLQIMQCWGDDDGLIPSNPGPPPEQCVFGAVVGATPGGSADLFATGRAGERVLSIRGWSNSDPSEGYFDQAEGVRWMPFRAVDGTVINVSTNPKFDTTKGGDFWLNTYFNQVTTNEIPAARTGAGGTGAELFEVTTGVESSGLGCGQAAEPVADGPPRVPKCWLVVVPRAGPDEENVGTPSHGRPGSVVVTSPLTRRSWENRIAIPLEFNPVDSPCSLGADLRRLAGTELALPAVVSWQPALCAVPGLSPYSYSLVSDASARQQIIGSAAGAPGMVVVSRPIDRSLLSPAKPVVYAPISLSALVIGFNIERIPDPTPTAPIPDEEALRGVRVAELNLTPRLVAKLLTQSYYSQVAIGAAPPPYEWVKGNARDLAVDRDFLQFNPEFELLNNSGKNLGGLVMSSLNSDAARQVWEWVFADPEAKAWLDGEPDPWGMKVNPVYATTAETNSAGAAFGDPVPSTYPKSDPYCYEAPAFTNSTSASILPPPLCGGDWLPYALGMREAARATRAADDAGRTTGNIDALSPSQAYKRDGPQKLGSRSILSLTDSASAFQYGIQMARLSRAGDDEPDRAFIAPDTAGLTAGVGAMAVRDEPAVREPDPTATAPAAYPLTALTYAAIAPLSLDTKAREEYASFVDYAAGPGQVAGLELGQLPRGFVELPEDLRTQAAAAAKSIRELKPAGAAHAASPAGGAGSPSSAGSGTSAPATTVVASSAASSGASASRSQAAAETATPSTSVPVPVAEPEASFAQAAPAAPLARALTPVLALTSTRFVLPGLVGV
ncbi:MAG TPA: hypothetical protein VF244_10200, partial [Acidimicrobiales bacterium]